MKNRSLIKRELENLPACKLKDLKNVWIEVMLERAGGNRAIAAKNLGISSSTIRYFIIDGDVKAQKSVTGRPLKLLQQ